MLAKSVVPEVRDLKFEVGPSIPRFWKGGSKSITAFFNNLSVFFPPGERFFIASVRAYRDQVRDLALQADMRAFYGQEGIHTREHVRYNEMLVAQGYPIHEMEQRIENLLGRVKKNWGPRMQLGVTCALEHFTALMAELILADPALMADADKTMAELWRWHAAEENEHKSVAFDTFKYVGGTYLERSAAMIGATVVFWAKVLEQQVRVMHADGTLWSAEEWRTLAQYLFQPNALPRLVPAWFDYFRPGFHPTDHDSTQLLEAWKRELAASHDYGRHAAA